MGGGWGFLTAREHFWDNTEMKLRVQVVCQSGWGDRDWTLNIESFWQC